MKQIKLRSRAGIVLAVLLSLAACSSAPTASNLPNPSNPTNPSNPNPSNGLNFGATTYVIDKGLAELQGERAYHYQVDLSVTDGTFVPITYYIYVGDIPIAYTYWIAADATAEVFVEMYSDGAKSFNEGTFEFVAPTEGEVGEPSRIGQNYFKDAYVGIDTNASNTVEEDEEIKVIGGSITLVGALPDFSMSFDLQLANGMSAKGVYKGSFTVIDD